VFLVHVSKLVSYAVVGSPVEFKVIDVNKVVVRGDGLGLVPTNRPALFFITAPDAKLSDIDVAITSKSRQHVYITICFIYCLTCNCLVIHLSKSVADSARSRRDVHFPRLCLLNGHFSKWTWVSQYQTVSILDFTGAKDDGGGGDNWSYKTRKAPVKLSVSSPPANQHPAFYRPDAFNNNNNNNTHTCKAP